MEIKIRKATIEDVPDIARVHIRSWQAAYRGIVSDKFLNNISVEERIDTWKKRVADKNIKVLVAVTDRRLAGWASLGKPRDTAPAGWAEIWNIYLDPDFYRMGIGTRLMKSAVAELRRKKFTSAYLWVIEENTNARAFYEKLGYQADGTQKMIDWAGQNFVELRYSKNLV